MMSCQRINKNASLRCTGDFRIHVKDKTHEQRKQKRKRKKYATESNNLIIYLQSRLKKVLQPQNRNKTCKYVLPIPKRVIICYPLSRTDFSKPLLPVDDMSYPTQVSEQQGSDEYVFSNGRSTSYMHCPSADQSLRQNGLAAEIKEHQNETPFVRAPDKRNRQSEDTEQNIRRKFMKPPRHPEFVNHDKRLMSYARWYKQKPDPTALCNAGFFYTNNSDLVRCYQCGIGLKDFSSADNALTEHVKHSPDCPYLQEYLGQQGLEKLKKQVCGDDMQLYVNKTSRYRHPEYQAYSIRLSSFGKWPTSLMQKPEQLAAAGFYYTGFDDQVRCFACDGGLRKWDPEDDPVTEHCRWFPECPFVLEQKGEEYVKLIQTATANEIQKRLGNASKAACGTIGPENDILCEMERLHLNDPKLDAVIKEHRDTCLEMGYQEKDFEHAATKLVTGGNIRPTIEDIIDALESKEESENQPNFCKQETPKEENERLKRMLYCMACNVNSVNALFLPCTHHRLCMTCAEKLNECPVCDRRIRQKIKTFLV